MRYEVKRRRIITRSPLPLEYAGKKLKQPIFEACLDLHGTIVS
jgi:hypothetical protein